MRRRWWLVLALAPGCKDDGKGDGDESSSSTAGDETSGSGTSSGSSSVGEETGSSDEVTGSPTTDPETSSESSTGEPQQCGDGQDAVGQTCFAPPEILLADRPTAAVALVDLDGDGNLDLVAGHLDGYSVWIGDGTGTFADPISGASDPIGAVAFGQVDGDAWPDLVMAHPQHDRVTVRIGTGTGSFGPPLDIDVDGDGTMGNAGPRGLALGDLDDDGDTDVAVVSELDGALRLFFQDGPGFDVSVEVPIGGTPAAVAFGQLGGAAGRDLAVANFAGASVALFEHTGGTTYAPGPSLAVGAGPRGLVVLDLDGDGTVDLATADSEGGSASILLGSGQGFAPALVLPVGAQPRALAAADFDNDGNLDLALALDTQNAIGVLLRDGDDDEFAMLPATAVDTHARPDCIAAGDLDGNGIDDVVTGSAAAGGGVAILRADP